GVSLGVSAGATIITASSGSASASATLNVTNAAVTSINVTPPSANVPLGVFSQFSAMGTFDDGTSHDITPVTNWISSDPTIAQLQSSGLAWGVGTGTANVSATFESATGSGTLTVATPVMVSIAIQPSNGTCAVGTTLQLSAIGTYNDGSTHKLGANQVTWSTSQTSMAAMTTTGVVSCQIPGTASVTSTSGSVTSSTNLTVTS